MLGLFAFFYACLHFTIYALSIAALNFAEIGNDIAMRPYVTVGFTGFVLMIPLAVTSTKKWIGRLGGRRWQMLHRLIYVSAIAGVLHYLWLVKADIRFPVRYGIVVGLLLLFRVWTAFRSRQAVTQVSGG
jgi:sulfoxide reductase heme-binding subunit YedZ